jgi:hypothetical protein
MPTFQEHLKQRSSPFATKKSTQPLQEGLELSASDLIDEMTAPQAKSISATVVTDNHEELTILLQVKKCRWHDRSLSPTTTKIEP